MGNCKLCANCGEKCPVEYAFCIKCGSAFPTATASPINESVPPVFSGDGQIPPVAGVQVGYSEPVSQTPPPQNGYQYPYPSQDNGFGGYYPPAVPPAPESGKGGKSKGLIAAITVLSVVLVVLIVAVLGLFLGNKDDEGDGDSGDSSSAAVTEEAPAEATEKATEKATEEVTIEITEETTEKQPAGSTYKIVHSAMSWDDAKRAAENAGGHLAVITSRAEYEEIARLCDESGLKYLWLGARAYYDGGSYQWITGESWSFENWYPDEPSYYDKGDGSEELYLCLWKIPGYDWTFNDQRSDLIGSGLVKSDQLGYIIEFEN